MTQVDVDDKVYDEIKNFVENNKIQYPSIKNYIDRNLQACIQKDNEGK